ncbi:MAG: type II toxin-antitoxin system RelE/ParE family toxin [Chlorobiaceae bacterium]|nr:type II toxin-antitoxin system RelE/ParE family toxin [Chlorobiaceae bacterium]
MSAGYAVLWTEVAERDLREIIAFIAGDSPQNALHLLEKIKDEAAALYTSPERGRVVPELHSCGIFIYRELINSLWRVLYRIVDSTVYITAVLDSRRNAEDILLHRLIQG